MTAMRFSLFSAAVPTLPAYGLLCAALLLAACSESGPSGTPDPVEMPPPDAPVGIAERPANTQCVAADVAPSGSSDFTTARAFPSLPALSQLVTMTHPPNDDSRWYAVLQPGVVHLFENDESASSTTVVLDITDEVESDEHPELGLLGLAFHPEFATNGYAYVYFSLSSPLRTRISRFNVDANGTFQKATELPIIDIAQPFGNHNGGHIAFGPDGMLYLGLGDGGNGSNIGDPDNQAQRPSTLLGSMLRLDVDNPDSGMNYGIPSDNPFADGTHNGEAGAPEVWAWGLRNPYRWSFDTLTGSLWLADVGHGSYEEVSVIERGNNYGWNVLEGFSCYNASSCSQEGRTPPEADYPRNAGRSVTGGYIYRGGDIPGLRGKYIFGDFISGFVWAIERNAGRLTRESVDLETGLSISGFAQDLRGEIFILNYSGGAGNGIHAIVPTTPTDDSDNGAPELLSETGCVNMADPTTPAANTVPYTPNARFWSDGAAKHRAAALPDGARFDVDTDGDFDFPVGSVLIKHFELGGSVFETRLFMHHQDGWAGYSYRWNQARTEATLLTEGMQEMVAGQQWHYPSRAECFRCHTDAAGVSLGLEAGQLNHSFTYPSGTQANQLDTLEHINWPQRDFTAAQRTAVIPDSEDTTQPLQDRAKAYLHTNCANCHRPNGPTGTSMDLRFSTGLAAMNVCNETPTRTDLGNSDNRLLSPGAPENSLLNLRMRETDGDQMPPLSVNVVDTDGVELLEAWISSITACP